MPNRRNNNEPEVKISAPYNFVPLNKEVFFPPWAPFVNHDIPFKDGLSGTIALEITAESPLFIGSGKEDDDGVKQFCKDSNGKYFIPGSSIRNMLRSVVEIMSFGKLNIINEETKPLSFRDMANKNIYPIQGDRTLRKGYLYKHADDIYILDDGELEDLNVKINQTDLVADTDLNTFRTASISGKYNLCKKGNLANNINTQKEIIVLTGNFTRKQNEFRFSNPNTLTTQFKIDQQFKEFQFAHNKTESWDYWLPFFNQNKYVPVFFRLNENGNEILDFGLTVLYKKAYKNSLLEVLKKNQHNCFDKKKDLSECIFGTEKNKGRLFVKHAFANEENIAITKHEHVLSEPKYSFYPNYLSQNVNPDTTLIREDRNYKYATFNDDDAELSGRKRYPIHSIFNPVDIVHNNLENDNNNDEVKTTFAALPTNTSFTTEIIYHNLHPIELGAIYSAITFHNTKTCRHNIGLAKPLGFGKIYVKIKSNTPKITNYMAAFENCMNAFENNWIKSQQMNELLSMAAVIKDQDRRKLKYMRLEDFQNVKKTRIKRNDHTPKALPIYSDFMLNSKPIMADSLNGDKIDLNRHISYYEFKNKLESKIDEIKATYKILNQKTKISNKIKEGEPIEVLIKSIKPKRVKINLKTGLVEVQFCVEKGFDISQIKIGDTMTATIHQLKKDGTINIIKIKNL